MNTNQKDTQQAKRRPHADLIIAWANGAEIEVLTATGNWELCTKQPLWHFGNHYRLKPEPVVHKVYLYRTELGGLVSTLLPLPLARELGSATLIGTAEITEQK